MRLHNIGFIVLAGNAALTTAYRVPSTFWNELVKIANSPENRVQSSKFSVSPNDHFVQELCLATNSGEECVDAFASDDRNTEDKTIWEVLDDPHFSTLKKLVGYDDKFASVLKDPSANLTFFAVPNSGLPHPRDDLSHGLEAFAACSGESEATTSSCLQATDEFARLIALSEADSSEFFDNEDDDDDDEKKKKILKKILHAVLQYHTLPAAANASDIVTSNTHATGLQLDDGSLDNEPLRLRVIRRLFGRSFTVNLYAKTIKTDIQTKNGVIHVLDHPLFPPGSIFQTLFLFSDGFSIATTALQRVGLDSAVEWRYEHDDDAKGSVEGTPLTTFFAPSNKAFERLPRKLKLFLFSPLGEGVLSKLLQLHVVPTFAFHSDWTHNGTSKDVAPASQLFRHACFSKSPSVLIDGSEDAPAEYDLPTLLPNHTLHVSVKHFGRPPSPPGHPPIPSPPQRTVLFVNGQLVPLADIPARNGALHVIGKVINPRKGGHHGDDGDDDKLVYGDEDGGEDESWEGWEDWLIDWADKN